MYRNIYIFLKKIFSVFRRCNRHLHFQYIDPYYFSLNSVMWKKAYLSNFTSTLASIGVIFESLSKKLFTWDFFKITRSKNIHRTRSVEKLCEIYTNSELFRHNEASFQYISECIVISTPLGLFYCVHFMCLKFAWRSLYVSLQDEPVVTQFKIKRNTIDVRKQLDVYAKLFILLSRFIYYNKLRVSWVYIKLI